MVGASAGGVEALRALVRDLPRDLPAAVFIVLHVWPGARSFLPEILTRSGPLPAEHAVNGERIVPGKIYIAPPDMHLFVDEQRVSVLRGPRENRARPSINALFRSAAAACGSRVIGVILTGTLDDGAAGLWAVKQCGGLAIVQDPSTAHFPEMPQSALDGVEADFCGPVAEIARRVVQHVHEPRLPGPPRAVPEVVHLTNQRSQMKVTGMQIDKIGERSLFSCPECNGALWELSEGENLSYHCHVGHAYSASTLKHEQHAFLEQSLWSALRSLTESYTLDERLAQRSTEHGLQKAAEIYRRAADEKKLHGERLRQFLATLRPPFDGAPANSAAPLPSPEGIDVNPGQFGLE